MNRSSMIRHPESTLTSEVEMSIRKAFDRLMKHEPVQYILGEAPFMGMMLYVDPAVLIPRPETEELVEMIIRANKFESLRILDIGTGSGCIAIALKKAIPNAMVTAIDFSSEALDIAKGNAARQKVNIKFELLDILLEEQWKALGEFEIIVSNPPYISVEEMDKLEKNVREFEPSAALFAPREDPLLFYRKIARLCQQKLHSEGKLFLEINNLYSRETATLLRESGFNCEVIEDLFGNRRFIESNRYR